MSLRAKKYHTFVMKILKAKNSDDKNECYLTAPKFKYILWLF